MKYEVVQDKRNMGWAVEAIDSEGDGEVHRTLFMGPQDQERAQEYAQWMNRAIDRSRVKE